MAESLYPPHSRLYVTCDKDITEEELYGAFQCYGNIVNVNLCRDRNTGQPKGFAFVQYDKTSQAAAAMENLNGSTVGYNTRPIKVTVALTKEQSGSGASDPSQFLRLFLVVPKTATEDDLFEYFSKFGEIDNVNIVKNRATKESKGFAYVKYKKFSDAAKAYENCDSSYKVVFAKPKDAQGPQGSTGESNAGCTHIDDNPDGYTCLKAMVPVSLSDEQIEWIFDIPPGLDFVRFFNEPPFMGFNGQYARKIQVYYETPGTAAYALRKLDGFEYPPGDRIIVKPEFHFSERSAGPDSRTQRGGKSTQAQGNTDLMRQVETLTNSLAEANRLLRSAGLYTPIVKDLQQVAQFRCSAKLPPPQPLAPPNSVAEERLFLVCEPGLPPQDALWDVFGRFGNLIDLYILNGKNCGYAKYASRASAQRAIQALNGQDLYRMKMKVLVAEPQREDRKRPKFD